MLVSATIYRRGLNREMPVLKCFLDKRGSVINCRFLHGEGVGFIADGELVFARTFFLSFFFFFFLSTGEYVRTKRKTGMRTIGQLFAANYARLPCSWLTFCFEQDLTRENETQTPFRVFCLFHDFFNRTARYCIIAERNTFLLTLD